MTPPLPPAEELRILDMELRHLDARRVQLLARRAQLIALLRQPSPPAFPPAGPVPRQPETTAPRVQNVLLVLGGVLLTVAAIAFTLVSWGHLGIAGRSVVLAAVTAAVLGAPVPLLKRGLRSTAETLAGLGLALTVLDAYALHEVALTTVDGTGYAAVATALLAGMWWGYGKGLGELKGLEGLGSPRIPFLAALGAAQLPLLLGAVAVDASSYTTVAALLLTAAFDTAVALRTSARSLRIAAAVGMYGMGGWGVVTAGVLSWTATGPGAAVRAAALLACAAAIALYAAGRTPRRGLATGAAVTGGLLLVAALGGIPRALLPGVWTVPGYLACGVGLLAAVRGPLPDHVRRGAVRASAAVQVLAVAWALPLAVVALLGPVAWTGRVWSGAPSDLRAAVTVWAPWPADAAARTLVLVAAAAVLAGAARATTAWRDRAVAGAVVLVWATALVLPAVLRLPYAAGLSVQGLTAVAVLAVAGYARRTPTFLASVLLSLLTAAGLVLLSLASRGATLTVLAVLTGIFAGAAAHRRLTPVCASASLAGAALLACAVGAAADRSPAHTALLVLVVPAAAALLAARVPRAAVPVEATGAVAGLLAIGLAVTDAPVLALVLALCGVIAAGTAVRADRRWAGYVAAALFVSATWVRLGSWGVGTPEAYTLPVTVPALVVGFVRRRRAPETSSWTAYGPGLSATLVPSLTAAWADADWPRPLLLGTAALVLTLLGARHRLQAPLLLGGSVLVLDALHELAPYLVQLAGLFPRWLPPALAGLLLLALGATYEQRIRDARRIREALGRMR
ncbi:SCO7613 C-terminal domain-containing membrane protein [Streptomyces thermoalcalitolerans]